VLSLDDTQWGILRHAYGPAHDLPKRIASLNDGDLDFMLGALYHQGDTYTAAYAALPYLVERVQNLTNGSDSLVQLIGLIEVARLSGRGPTVPTDLAEAYYLSLEQLPEKLAPSVKGADKYFIRAILGTLAAVAGKAVLARAIFDLEEGALAHYDEVGHWEY
jgi:hypothetical protein